MILSESQAYSTKTTMSNLSPAKQEIHHNNQRSIKIQVPLKRRANEEPAMISEQEQFLRQQKSMWRQVYLHQKRINCTMVYFDQIKIKIKLANNIALCETDTSNFEELFEINHNLEITVAMFATENKILAFYIYELVENFNKNIFIELLSEYNQIVQQNHIHKSILITNLKKTLIDQPQSIDKSQSIMSQPQQKSHPFEKNSKKQQIKSILKEYRIQRICLPELCGNCNIVSKILKDVKVKMEKKMIFNQKALEEEAFLILKDISEGSIENYNKIIKKEMQL